MVALDAFVDSAEELPSTIRITAETKSKQHYCPKFHQLRPQFWNYETEFCNRSAPSTVAVHTNNEMVLRDKSSNYSPEGRVAKLPEPI
jgi:hypothetical protein